MDKTAAQAVMDKLIPFSIEQALVMGPFVQLTVGFRNANRPDNSFFLTALVSKPNLQAVTDALDNLDIITISELVTQTINNTFLMIGFGETPGVARAFQETRLMLLGRETQTESIRMQMLMLTNDLLLTVTEKGADFGEFIDPDDCDLVSAIRVFERVEEAANSQSVIQSLAPADGADTSFGVKLAAAVNKTT